MKIKVVFDLPEGMSQQDLLILLRDSLDDFRTVRCDGDARAYAEKSLGLARNASELEGLERKAKQVQTRFDWTRHFQRDGRNMHLDDPRLED